MSKEISINNDKKNNQNQRLIKSSSSSERGDIVKNKRPSETRSQLTSVADRDEPLGLSGHRDDNKSISNPRKKVNMWVKRSKNE